ncbi:hypothetical protein ACOJBO_09200 [Rhizobium beringeri]
MGQQSNTVETGRPADVGRHNYRHRLSAALPRFTFANVITEKVVYDKASRLFLNGVIITGSGVFLAILIDTFQLLMER